MRTLGALDLRDGEGREVSSLLSQPKRLALLVYLASSGDGRFHRRDTLLGLFWPEISQERARNALNKALYFIRNALGKDIIVSRGGEEVRLDSEWLWCDAAAFARAVVEGRPEEAVDLYRGPFLEGFHVTNALEFDLWLERERESLSEQYAASLEALATQAASEGDAAGSVVWWRRCVEHDPLSARALMGLMKALATVGERGAALVEADRYAEILKRELDAEPDPDVVALVERLRLHPRPAGDIRLPPIAAPQPKTAADERIGRALPMTEHGRRARHWPTRPALAAAAVAVSLVIVFLALRSSRDLRPGEAVASAPGRSIAVLPFLVSDPALQLYGEGMVALLGASLDGVGGLRVLEGEGGAPLARYVIAGRVTGAGDDLRLTAVVHDAVEGRRIERITASGPADSVFSMVDQLSIGIIRAVLGPDAASVGGVHLAAVTTSSLPALEAFLEGEQAYRGADFATALAAYERAIRADSTFALAHYRLSLTLGWTGGSEEDNLRRAMRFVDRLPLREAWSVRAYYAWYEGSPDLGFRLAQRATQHYPEYPEAWYVLGELYHHFGGQTLAPSSDTEQAMGHAVTLAPTFAPFHHHLIDWTFLRADSASAARRIRAYAQIAAGEGLLHGYRLAFDLGFGSHDTRSRAIVALDTVPTQTLREVGFLLDHPRFWHIREAVLMRVLERPDRRRDATDVLEIFETLWGQGRLEAARRSLEDPRVDPGARAAGTHLLLLSGARFPPGWSERALAFSPGDTLGWLYAGAGAIDREESPDLNRILAAAREASRQRRSEGDTVSARAFDGLERALAGYRLWHDGRREEALHTLADGQRRARGWFYVHHWNMTIRWWIGRLLIELDRPDDALRYLNTIWLDWEDPYAAYEVARIHSARDEDAKAAEAYRYALEAWRRADPEVDLRRDEARRALAALSPE